MIKSNSNTESNWKDSRQLGTSTHSGHKLWDPLHVAISQVLLQIKSQLEHSFEVEDSVIDFVMMFRSVLFAGAVEFIHRR